MNSYVKKFVNTPSADIRREYILQQKAASIGLAPDVRSSDFKTFICMDHLNEMSIADFYGDDIEAIPECVKEQIVEILWVLYSGCDIEYIDVTPYNFIEKNGMVWIIDFGHAQHRAPGTDPNPFLEQVFQNWELTEWNPQFK